MARVLIAGLGSIGRRHLRNLRQLGVEDCLLLRTRAEPLAEAPELPVFTDLEQALAAKPDLVIVSNPTARHLEVAGPAAEAGCDLFIEKPLSHNWEGVERFLEVVRQKGVMTLAGFDLRFEPGLRRVRALLEEGVIGRVIAIQAQVGQYLPDWHPWEDYRIGGSARRDMGGGVILDLIHELDYVTWLNGEVTEVACMADTVSGLEIETEDVAALLLRFANGSIGSVQLDYIQRSPSRTCRVIGEEGTICWDYFGRDVSWHTVRTGEWERFQYADHDRDDRFREEMRHLLDCHARKERPMADAVTGSQVLRLALAAKEAAVTRRTVTPISSWQPASGLCQAARS